LNPLISIIIPTYNHADFLGLCLQSVIDQTYKNWEAIVIDNNSNDNTEFVIKNFNDNRIRLLKVNNNGIIAVSRNIGVLNAKGDWICFLDSDDSWTNNKIETCIKYCNYFDIIYHDLQIIGKKKYFFNPNISKGRKLKSPITIDFLLNGNAINNSSVMVRSSLLHKIGLINEARDMIAAEDYNTWLKLSCITEKFLYIKKSLGYYFVHQNGVSQKNMSDPTKNACNEFLYKLDHIQINIFQSLIKYINGSFYHQQAEFEQAISEFKFSISNGTLRIKLKSFYKISACYNYLYLKKIKYFLIKKAN
jgi:glycosyltransferase involved in cell wall biosynthesis